MEWWLILLIIFGSLLIFMLSGIPVAFSLILINLAGVMILWGGVSGIQQLTLSMGGSVSTFSLLPVALFILMAEVFFQSGMALRAIDVLDKWMGRMPGGLGFLAVAAGTPFGIAVANRALILFDVGDKFSIEATDSSVRVLLLTGKPLNEPIAWHGPIVMNTQAELEVAFREYREGTFVKR